MLIFKKIALIVILMASVKSIKAVEKFNNTDSIKLTIRFKYFETLKNENQRLVVTISEMPFGGIEFMQTNLNNIWEQKITQGLDNIFILPSPKKYMYIHIGCLSGPKGELAFFSWIDNIYVFEQGTEVLCEINSQGYFFSGKSATVPNVQSKLILDKIKNTNTSVGYMNNKEYLNALIYDDRSLDSILQLQLGIIKEQEKISSFYRQLLIANCFGYRYFEQLRSYHYEALRNPTFLKVLKSYYHSEKQINTKEANISKPLLSNHNARSILLAKFSNLRNYLQIPDSILALAPIYSTFLIENFKFAERLKYESYQSILSKDMMQNIINRIKLEFTGVMRDKLLATFMISTKRYKSSVDFYERLIPLTKHLDYKNILIKNRNLLTVGSKFRDFSLTDTTGRVYSLKDFNEKLVVMDFWFTGCTNCVKLNTAMKPVYAHFKNVKEVLFVSVSVDKNRQQWKNSILKEEYSHHDALNLFTNGEGSKHDLITYYQLAEFPAVKIFKEGRLVSASPPRPTIGIQPGLEISKDATELIKLIEDALERSRANSPTSNQVNY